MNDKKFNPIVQLPTLPGAEIAQDFAPHTPPEKYPPTEVTNKNGDKPRVEIRMKPAESKEPEELQDQNTESKRLTLIRAVILVCLIVLILAGILLTIQVVPQIISKVSNIGGTFNYLFVSKKTNTANNTPSSISLVATTTPNQNNIFSTTTSANTSAINNVSNNNNNNNQVDAQNAAVKTPAKLIAMVMSTEIVGNRTYVKFNVQNVGGTTSGKWSFTAKLPSSATPVYYSQIQNPLSPFSGIFFTMGFVDDRDTPVEITIN
jgi:hypothetical protein